MKEKRILRILGQVDEKYIEEAAPWKRVVGDSSMFPSLMNKLFSFFLFAPFTK